MAGQRENNEVTPRPSHRTVSMWKDLQAALEHIRHAEFHLGLLAEKPNLIDWDAVEVQLGDARGVLGQMALALSDEVDS